MAILNINVPDKLYEALRGRARERHRSIAAEVLSLLEENIPTRKELQARRQLLRRLERVHSKARRMRRSFAATEEMQREDRQR
jgi:plasmid stability protein